MGKSNLDVIKENLAAFEAYGRAAHPAIQTTLSELVKGYIEQLERSELMAAEAAAKEAIEASEAKAAAKASRN